MKFRYTFIPFRITRYLVIYIVICQLFYAYISPIFAKTRYIKKRSISSILSGKITTDKIRIFESNLTPFLQYKASGKLKNFPENEYIPSNADFFLIACYSNSFSGEFMDLYKRAITKSDTSLKYKSPSGNFLVYYSIDGNDSVDTKDTYSYGINGDWRRKIEIKNGIPDYVDEVAWALDSAWSMEIERFGFLEPYPTQDSYMNPQPYKVYICDVIPNYYGQTFWVGKVDDTPVGHASYIEIRNNWLGWNDSEIIDYEDHPEKGIYITSVHEFFHAIQYAMTWNVDNHIYLDEYPISWLEGTAVMMEDLAFDYVNDYTQYLDRFFEFPTYPFFDDTYDGITEYKNSILALWLYEFASLQPGIDFIKGILVNNYQSKKDFHVNLKEVSITLGHTWPELLGSFFTGSYFTGERANTAYFVKDAALLDQWRYHLDTLDTDFSIRKEVTPYSMQTFNFFSSEYHNDTLFVHFEGEIIDMDNQWATNVILKRRESYPDTIINMPLENNKKGDMIITGWQSCKEALVIATNANHDVIGTGTVTFLSGKTIHTDTLQVSDTSGNFTNSIAHIKVIPSKGLFGDLSLSIASPNEKQSTAIIDQNLKSCEIYYEVNMPAYWFGDRSIELTIALHDTMIEPFEMQYEISTNISSIYRFNEVSESWEELITEISDTGDFLMWKVSLDENGIYSILQSLGEKLNIYPNPVRLYKHQYIFFKGLNIKELNVYTISGNRVISATEDNSVAFPSVNQLKHGFSWNMKSLSNRRIIPGTYIAIVSYKDSASKEIKYKKKKILVLP